MNEAHDRSPDGQTPNVPTSVRLPGGLRDKVEQTAHKRHLSLSDVVVEALLFYYDHEEGKSEVTEDQVKDLIDQRVEKAVEEKIREFFAKVGK